MMLDAPFPQILRSLRQQPPPEVLNFQVNDICNARCVMCNIWQNKRGKELSPDEFTTLLRQPYFQQVKYVGITGGEPTLRGDLHRFYETLPAVLPHLVGASFITNGFKTTEAISAYGQVHRSYAAAGKQFSGMVSLDGVGEVHDVTRGRPGAFAKTTATLFGLRDAGVSVQAACTIVRSNVWGVDDLLAWARQHNVYVRFRVGEFIRRLYNLGETAEIRAFDGAETRHLVAFYHRLLLEYEKEEGIRRTYTSILSVLTGGERLVTCPYQTTGSLNLDSTGRFAVCAPQGTPTALGTKPAHRTRRVLERLVIRARHCPKCIHDYHGAWTMREGANLASAAAAGTSLAATPPLPAAPLQKQVPRRVLVLGWYGTETAGDIAILGGLLLKYSTRGTQSFTVLSLYPYYSRLTLKPLAAELGIRLEIEAYDSPRVIDHLEDFDTVIMGGGPLMDLEQTKLIRNFFRRARARGIPCHLEGCGLGPLHHERFRKVVAEILALSTEIRLRDSASADFARQLAGDLPREVVPDPSIDYVRSLGIEWGAGNHGVIRVFFRMLTNEYPQDTSPEAANALVVELLRKVLAWYPAHQVELCAMHWFPVGWDDRQFGAGLVRAVADPRLTADRVPRTPRELLQKMATADLNLCMRFHSVVFAHTIGAPFVALDYTAGGKVQGFLADRGLPQAALRYAEIPALDHEQFSRRICHHRK